MRTTRATPPHAATSAFEIGPARLVVEHDDELVARLVRHLDPLRPLPAADRQADLVLRRERPAAPRAFDDVQNEARDGTTTASDGKHLFLLSGHEWCSVPAPWNAGPTVVRCSHAFPTAMLVARVVRPALQLSMTSHGASAIHSAAVAFGGRGVAVAGWSESGKTETALAMAEGGGTFVSDKWTPVDADRRISTFPISVGIRRWVLPYLPRLRRALPRTARAQLAAAGALGWTARPIVALGARGGAAGLASAAVSRATALADRAAVRPSELQRIYAAARGDDPPRLEVLALLRTTTGRDVVVNDADPVFAARRLARTNAYERQDFFNLHARANYALRRDADPRRRSQSIEERVLAQLLNGVRILDVAAPFPTDPRRVADAIRRRVGS